MPNEGILSVCVWPTFVGALMADGNEPISNTIYQRAQITWGVDEDGIIRGRATIPVCNGDWSYIIYCHHPTKPMFVAAQKLVHPIRINGSCITSPATIALTGITEQDVNPMAGCVAPNVVR